MYYIKKNVNPTALIYIYLLMHACIKTLENVIGVPRYKRLLFTWRELL